LAASGNLCASYVVQKDPTTGETTVTKVAGGGLNAGSNTNTTVQADPIKDRIIVLILEQFEEEIGAWLRINGKGGEDDPDVLLALDLPGCFKKDADVLEYIKDKTIPYYKEHPAELRAKIESNQTKKTLFVRIASLFKNIDEVDWKKVPDDDQQASRDATCDGLSQHVSENFAIEESETGEAIALDIKAPEYILCFTPAGKVYALPKETKLNFTNTTNVPVPTGALTSYYLHDEWYLAHYEKRNDKWYFDGYYKQGGGGRGSSYLTQEQLESYLDNNNGASITTASLGATLVIPLEKVILDQWAARLGTAAGQLKNVGRFTVVTIAASVVLELFVSTSSLEYGVGEVVLELPLPNLALSNDGNYVSNPPATIPVAIPHSLTNKNGYCHVYVIYGIGTGGPFVAKYGMTCQEDYANEGDCNPRPDLQCNKFKRENTDPTIVDYKYSWVIRNVDRDVAFVVERSMTAGYVIANKGKLPPKHYLPCFIRKDDFDERLDRATEWLNEQIKKFGKQ
jgi:hypothetical protein